MGKEREKSSHQKKKETTKIKKEQLHNKMYLNRR